MHLNETSKAAVSQVIKYTKVQDQLEQKTNESARLSNIELHNYLVLCKFQNSHE